MSHRVADRDAAAHRVTAAAVAAVWLHQGVCEKVAHRGSRHEAIVAGVPFVGPGRARATTLAIGLGEVGLAVWVLSGRAPLRAAAVQTLALVGMNVGGLVFSRQRISLPGRMLARNAGFLGGIWTLAWQRRIR